MAWDNALNQVISDNIVSGPMEASKLPFFSNTAYEDIADSSDQVSIVSVGDITTGTYVPGTDITIGTGSAGKGVLKCDQFKYFADRIDDTVKLVAQYATAYSVKAKAKLSLEADKYALGLATKANFPTNWIAGAADAAIDVNNVNILDQLDKVNEKLNEQGVAEDQRFIAVPPVIYTKIMKAAGVAAKTSDDLIFGGKVQKVRGLNILMSNQYVAAAGAYKCLFGVPDAVAVAAKPAMVEDARDPKGFATIVKALFRFGASVITEKNGGAIHLKAVADV